MKTKKHVGSDFEAFLREDGILDEVDARVQKRMIAEQLRAAMLAKQISEAGLARSMGTSRTVVRSLLDPSSDAATLVTLVRAASAVGRELRVTLELPRSSRRGAKPSRQPKTRGRPKLDR